MAEEEILGVVITEEEERWVAGDTVIFKAKDKEQKDKMALTLGRILIATVHELPTGVYILVKR